MEILLHKAIKIIKILNKNNYIAVFTGGYVRDMLLNLESNDIDIATNATPDQIEEVFLLNNYKVIPVGKSFGVIIVVDEEHQFEIASFRKDGEYEDGRHPEKIEFCSMEEDAKHRDFTVNGLFYDPINNKIIDCIEGKKDIVNRKIRFIGNPGDRILEDKLRMMRAVRFATKLNFLMVDETVKAIIDNNDKINQISSERIGAEITKSLQQSTRRSQWMDIMKMLGLLEELLPEVQDMYGVEQPLQFHPEGDVWRHTCYALDLLQSNKPEILWGTLLHDVGKPCTQSWDAEKNRFRFNCHDVEGSPIAEKILRRFKFSNEFIKDVLSLVENHMKFAAVTKMRKSKLKRFFSLSNFSDHIELHKADCLASNGSLRNIDFIKNKLDEFKNNNEELIENKLPKGLINGYDLINLNIKQGPVFKDILNACLDAQLENEFNNRKEALIWLKNYLKNLNYVQIQ